MLGLLLVLGWIMWALPWCPDFLWACYALAWAVWLVRLGYNVGKW